MRKLLVGTLLGLTLPLALVGVASALPAPGGGAEFGQHVAAMAPEHPREHGSKFGACVSQMARGEVCSHHGG